MTKYTVYSRRKGGKNWIIERSYTLKSYANQVEEGIRLAGRNAKVVKKK